jgi:hypothetical protein
VTGSAYDLRAAEHAATLSALEQPVAAHAAVVLARARGVVELDAQEDLRVRHARHALERPAVPHDAAVVPARARQVDAVAHLQLLHNGRCSIIHSWRLFTKRDATHSRDKSLFLSLDTN